MSSAVMNHGFASMSKCGGSKTFEEKVEIAVKRFKGALNRLGGSINVRSEGDMVDFGVKNVFNRDRQLGDYHDGSFKKVIIAAVDHLLEKSCEHDTERGMMIFKDYRPRRQHVSKKPPYRAVRTPQRFRVNS